MIKTAILDDCEAEIEELKNWLTAHQQIDFLGHFEDALSIHSKVSEIDLLFCDIELKQSNGFEFLRGLKKPPMVVFISSHGEYAIDSFEFEPLHFIQKPIEQAKVLESIERASQKLKTGDCSKDFIFVKSGPSDFVKVNFADILFVSAMDDFVQIHLANSRIITYTRLKDFKRRLPNTFVQTHRSFIVNLSHVQSVNTKDLELYNGMEIPVSKGYGASIREFLTK